MDPHTFNLLESYISGFPVKMTKSTISTLFFTMCLKQMFACSCNQSRGVYIDRTVRSVH